MTPATFPAAHLMLGEDQPQYLLLPAHRSEENIVTTCWELNPDEVEVVRRTRRIWVQIFTDGVNIQPQLLRVDDPL